jgi:hypothetical protein
LGSEPAEALPTDPDWAGEIVCTDVQTATTAAQPGDVWTAAQDVVNSRAADWKVAERTAGTLLRLRSTKRAPGREWLEIAVTGQNGRGARYTQRSTFLPRGIPGRVYWFFVRPTRVAAMRALTRDVVASADSEVRRRTSGAAPEP